MVPLPFPKILPRALARSPFLLSVARTCLRYLSPLVTLFQCASHHALNLFLLSLYLLLRFSRVLGREGCSLLFLFSPGRPKKTGRAIPRLLPPAGGLFSPPGPQVSPFNVVLLRFDALFSSLPLPCSAASTVHSDLWPSHFHELFPLCCPRCLRVFPPISACSRTFRISFSPRDPIAFTFQVRGRTEPISLLSDRFSRPGPSSSLLKVKTESGDRGFNPLNIVTPPPFVSCKFFFPSTDAFFSSDYGQSFRSFPSSY